MGKEIKQESPAISTETCPDIHRGKALGIASISVIGGGAFIALCISVAAILLIFGGSIVYGIVSALMAL